MVPAPAADRKGAGSDEVKDKEGWRNLRRGAEIHRFMGFLPPPPAEAATRNYRAAAACQPATQRTTVSTEAICGPFTASQRVDVASRLRMPPRLSPGAIQGLPSIHRVVLVVADDMPWREVVVGRGDSSHARFSSVRTTYLERARQSD